MSKKKNKAIKLPQITETNIKVKVVISGYVHELIKQLHKDHSNMEWSCIGKIEKREGFYEVVDIRFPKQSNKSAFTEFEDEGIEKLSEELLNEGEDLSKWKLWLHSHHTMQCFWSGVDRQQKEDLDDGYSKFWFSIVTAYRGNFEPQYMGNLDIFRPIKQEFDLDILIEDYDIVDLLKIPEKILSPKKNETTIAIENSIRNLEQEKAELTVDDISEELSVLQDILNQDKELVVTADQVLDIKRQAIDTKIANHKAMISKEDQKKGMAIVNYVRAFFSNRIKELEEAERVIYKGYNQYNQYNQYSQGVNSYYANQQQNLWGKTRESKKQKKKKKGLVEPRKEELRDEPKKSVIDEDVIDAMKDVDTPMRNKGRTY